MAPKICAISLIRKCMAQPVRTISPLSLEPTIQPLDPSFHPLRHMPLKLCLWAPSSRSRPPFSYGNLQVGLSPPPPPWPTPPVDWKFPIGSESDAFFIWKFPIIIALCLLSHPAPSKWGATCYNMMPSGNH